MRHYCYSCKPVFVLALAMFTFYVQFTRYISTSKMQLQFSFTITFIILLSCSKFCNGTIRTQSGIWTNLLKQISNGTGEVSRDLVMEIIAEKAFNEVVKSKLENGDFILGARLDPLWLFPIGPLQIRKKSIFKGQLTACNLHLHNMKATELLGIEIQRNVALSVKAVKLRVKIPIIWMTGEYRVKKGLLFGFFPSNARGSFNVDLKDVLVSVIASLNTDEHESVIIDHFEVAFQWKKSLVKYDRYDVSIFYAKNYF